MFSCILSVLDKSRLVYVATTSIITGVTIILIWRWRNKKRQEQPPTEWREIGVIGDVIIFPVKSMGAVRIEDEIECTKLGLKYGWLRDRSLMVVNQAGKFVTARQWPMLIKISPSVSGSTLSLNAPNMPTITIDLASLMKKKTYKTAVWGQNIVAIDCGEEIARWISQFILQADVGLRLAWYPHDRPMRNINYKGFPLVTTADTGIYGDATSYNLLNEASLTDLNDRLEDPITAQQFRPNFVIKGATAYEEDGWEWLKIGQSIFRNLMPCTRCLMTLIDPETGLKNSKNEPLETLRTYRQLTDPYLHRLKGNSPVLGIHLGLKGSGGSVRLGDTVYVGVPRNDM